ncbi:MAG: hypothetical protein ACRD9L_18515 [Bryobacteraceae bacterium]
MWNWFNCYLSGRHQYGPWCEPGTIFLRCVHCGRRSSGWAIGGKELTHTTAPAASATPVMNAPAAKRVLPFSRAAAR